MIHHHRPGELEKGIHRVETIGGLDNAAPPDPVLMPSTRHSRDSVAAAVAVPQLRLCSAQAALLSGGPNSRGTVTRWWTNRIGRPPGCDPQSPGSHALGRGRMRISRCRLRSGSIEMRKNNATESVPVDKVLWGSLAFLTHLRATAISQSLRSAACHDRCHDLAVGSNIAAHPKRHMGEYSPTTASDQSARSHSRCSPRFR